jgi:hypothetical protein
MRVFANISLLDIKVVLHGCARFYMLCVATLLVAGTAVAGDNAADGAAGARDGATLEAVLSAADDSAAGESANGASRPQVGMSVKQAIEMLGVGPDSETDVGAACGELNILTWDEDGTQIIGVGGTVTSIIQGTRSERRPKLQDN